MVPSVLKVAVEPKPSGSRAVPIEAIVKASGKTGSVCERWNMVEPKYSPVFWKAMPISSLLFVLLMV